MAITNQSIPVICDSNLAASSAVAKLKFVIAPLVLRGGMHRKTFALDFYTAARRNSKKKRFSRASGTGRLGQVLGSVPRPVGGKRSADRATPAPLQPAQS